MLEITPQPTQNGPPPFDQAGKRHGTKITAIMSGNFSRAKNPDAITDGIAMGVKEAAAFVFEAVKTGKGRELGVHELMQLGDYRKMNRIRKRVDEIVKDQKTAEALKPWFNQLCKRPCFSGVLTRSRRSGGRLPFCSPSNPPRFPNPRCRRLPPIIQSPLRHSGRCN